MSNGIKTELNIPDSWYDFYARLLPGATFIAALKILVLPQTKQLPNCGEIVLLAFAAYLCGLITQPIASRITGKIEKIIEGKKNLDKERLYIRKVQYKLGRTSRESMILDKMHGEVVFFVQMSLLGAVFLLLQYFFCLLCFDENLINLSNKLICSKNLICSKELLSITKLPVSDVSKGLNIFSIVVFFFEAIEVAFRRFNRAKSYYNSNKSPWKG